MLHPLPPRRRAWARPLVLLSGCLALALAGGCSDTDDDGADETIDSGALLDAGGAADTGSEGDVTQDGGGPTDGAGGVDGAGADAGLDPSSPCGQACLAPNACELEQGAPTCAEVCLGPDGDEAGLALVQQCLIESADCAGLIGCIGLEPPLDVVHPFDSVGPYGVNTRDIAGDFTVPTTTGPFTLSKTWTGLDSYIVFMTARDNGGAVFGYPEALWNTNVAELFDPMFAAEHVHYIFASYNDVQLVLDMETKVQAALGTLPAEERNKWKKRVHFVTEAVPPPGSPAGAGAALGWLADWGRANGAFIFGIDPFQQVREFGLLYLFPVEPQGVYLHSAAAEAKGWAYERALEDGRYQGPETVVTVAEEKVTKGGFITEVTFPSKDEMAAFDTLEVEMINHCEDHAVERCGEWDYLEYLYLCEEPTEPNALADTACQPKVAKVDAVAEVMGSCALPAEATPVACKADGDCPDSAACEGYVAPVEGVEAVAAETKACDCKHPDGSTIERTQTCNAEGTGFGACSCPCNIEVGRWITTYSREGNWITDISGMLALFREGGTWRMRWDAPGQPKKCAPNNPSDCWDTPYVVTTHLRFSTRGDKARPTQAVPLFGGGAWNETYNDKYEPFAFTVPDGVKKVELYALITGHGFGQDQANCAEFCNHEHHFSVNGGPASVKEHPIAGVSLGCFSQIDDGVTPNQLGTWVLGRGGWCPGLDVKPWVVDITDQLVSGENTVTYEGLFQGKPYTPIPVDGGTGFGGNIRLRSWLIFSE